LRREKVGHKLPFHIKRLRLACRGLSRDTGPLVLAHLSDLHLRRWTTRHERLLEELGACRPDLLLLTGDFISTRRNSLACLRRLLEGMPRGRTFLVRGNWEATLGPPLRVLREMIAEWGGTLLANESRFVETETARVRIVGLDDIYRGWPSFDEALRTGAADADLTVLLSHAPLTATLLPAESAVDLVLSGHTHGGQVRLPLLWRAVLPPCHGGFTSGLYRLGRTTLYVSRGFGGVGLVPIRFMCPPEVAFLEVSHCCGGDVSASPSTLRTHRIRALRSLLRLR